MLTVLPELVNAGPQACVLAIDPGSRKCGFAIVQRDGVVVYRSVVATEEWQAKTRNLLQAYRPLAILMGDGTGSKAMFQTLQQEASALPLLRVDESYTSEAARERYLKETPARGWRKLLPRGLRSPEQPYDDYVAVILVERFWQSLQNSEISSES